MIYIVHIVYTAYTVYTVHTVYTVYNVYTVYTVYNVYGHPPGRPPGSVWAAATPSSGGSGGQRPSGSILV